MHQYIEGNMSVPPIGKELQNRQHQDSYFADFLDGSITNIWVQDG